MSGIEALIKVEKHTGFIKGTLRVPITLLSSIGLGLAIGLRVGCVVYG
jgi:hypothetical protein